MKNILKTAMFDELVRVQKDSENHNSDDVNTILESFNNVIVSIFGNEELNKEIEKAMEQKPSTISTSISASTPTTDSSPRITY